MEIFDGTIFFSKEEDKENIYCFNSIHILICSVKDDCIAT